MDDLNFQVANGRNFKFRMVNNRLEMLLEKDTQPGRRNNFYVSLDEDSTEKFLEWVEEAVNARKNASNTEAD